MRQLVAVPRLECLCLIEINPSSPLQLLIHPLLLGSGGGGSQNYKVPALHCRIWLFPIPCVGQILKIKPIIERSKQPTAYNFFV